MKKLQKGFIWPVLLVLVVLVGIGSYMYWKHTKNTVPAQVQNQVHTQNSQKQSQPQTQPVAVAIDPSWKTYTNTEYGLEFKYPPELPISEGNGGYYEYDVCLQPGGDGTNGDSCGAFDNTTGKFSSLQVMIIDKNSDSKNYADEISQSTNYTLLKAENGPYMFAFMSDKNQTDTISKIFATFQAVPIQNNVSSEWKTYANADYGFQLSYPAFYGDFMKVGTTSVWTAANRPLPSKTAQLDIKVSQSDSPTITLFGDIFGVSTDFDFNKEQFFTTGNSGRYGDTTRMYVEKKYLNGNLYYQTMSGEGGDGWWGNTTAYFIFDSKNKSIITLQTGNNPNTYNKGPKPEEIFGTFKLLP